MKTSFLFLAACLFAVTAYAQIPQVPQRMSYQAVVRDANGILITNTSITMKVSILSGNAVGTPVYVETHTATTNPNGLLTLQVGGGTVISGVFSAISWSAASFFIKTEADLAGGTNYNITGTSQLLSVPYALYAGNGVPGPQGQPGIQGQIGPQGPQGPAGATGAAGTFSVPFSATVNSASDLIDITNSGSGRALRAVTASSNNHALYAQSTSATGAAYVAAIRAQNAATGANGIGLWASHSGSGWGVYGVTASGVGIYGEANTTGTAILGTANNLGGYAGIFTGGNVGIGTQAPNNARLEVWGATTGNNAAIQAISTTITNPAVEISGPIKVSGLNPAAFIVQGQNANSNNDGYTVANQMVINNSICNNDATALLFITHNYGANNNNIVLSTPVSAYYNSGIGRWIILMQNPAGTMPLTAFNVLVIKR